MHTLLTNVFFLKYQYVCLIKKKTFRESTNATLSKLVTSESISNRSHFYWKEVTYTHNPAASSISTQSVVEI